jgi:hypothetical protein
MMTDQCATCRRESGAMTGLELCHKGMWCWRPVDSAHRDHRVVSRPGVVVVCDGCAAGHFNLPAVGERSLCRRF